MSRQVPLVLVYSQEASASYVDSALRLTQEISSQLAVVDCSTASAKEISSLVSLALKSIQRLEGLRPSELFSSQIIRSSMIELQKSIGSAIAELRMRSDNGEMADVINYIQTLDYVLETILELVSKEETVATDSEEILLPKEEMEKYGKWIKKNT